MQNNRHGCAARNGRARTGLGRGVTLRRPGHRDGGSTLQSCRGQRRERRQSRRVPPPEERVELIRLAAATMVAVR